MKINVFKTEVKKFSGTNDNKIKVSINGQEIENVNEFCYPDAWICNDGKDQKEIKCRIGRTKKAFNNLSSVLRNLHFGKRVMKCYCNT